MIIFVDFRLKSNYYVFDVSLLLLLRRVNLFLCIICCIVYFAKPSIHPAMRLQWMTSVETFPKTRTRDVK